LPLLPCGKAVSSSRLERNCPKIYSILEYSGKRLLIARLHLFGIRIRAYTDYADYADYVGLKIYLK
jgi:hypothetical protein